MRRYATNRLVTKHSAGRDVDPPEGPKSFSARVAIAAGIAIALLALAVFLWYSLHVLLLIFASVLIAILLSGLSDWVSARTRLPYLASLAVVIVVIVGSIGGLLWFSAAELTAEIDQLADRIPASIATLRQKIDSSKLGHILLSETPQFNAMLSGSGDLLGNLTGMVSRTFGTLVSLLVVSITALYLASNARLYVRGVIHLVPPPHRERATEVLGAIGYTLKWWLIGQSIDMVVIGIATAIGLWLLGVPLAMVLGLLAALFNFIPNFGPLFALVPALLLTLPTDPKLALYVVLLFVFLQGLEGYVLMPLIQGKAVNMPGALTIIVQLLMSVLAGGIGLAMAAPLAAATLVAVKMLYVEDLIGDRIKTPADGDAHREVREVQESAGELVKE
jgi:predicted PurR-regulated permease PerM